MPSVIIGLALLAFWLYCLLDVITTPGQEMMTLSKPLWVLIVVVLAALGGLFWLFLGRPPRVREIVYGPMAARARASHHETPRGPDDDPEFLRRLERRLRDED
ncbi:PLD nuclease N-terminal domain-containing protein [Microbispora oryzae]|nr:PLD nuclease N-terminal domain-containing protein [Microbispora oryzae]